MRRRISTALLVVAALLLPVGVVASWARDTLYDSTTFSNRTVDILRSSAVRTVLARRLTEELARSGNEQAVNFRPGLQLAIQTVVDTDAFRSIFRTAVRRTHAAILSGQNGSAGLNLQDSVAIITSSLQASESPAQAGEQQGGLGDSLSDVTHRLGDLGIWKLDRTIASIAWIAILGALAAAAGALVLAGDRRRCVRRLGWVLVVDGAVIVLALQLLGWWAQRQVDGADLADAVGGAFTRGTADLRAVGLWIAGYGLVAVAAATVGVRYTPAVVADRFRGWVDRRRATTFGTVVLGVLALLAGLFLVQDPSGNVRLVAVVAGMWLSYLGITEILRLVRSLPVGTSPRAQRRHVALVASTVAVLVALASVGLFFSAAGAAKRADAAGKVPCNGDESLCDLRIDQVMFPGTHNSMSSSLYPGFLFGEQLDTIKGQLQSGIRAFLIDTHYGVPSRVRLPGSDTRMVLTDRAAELRQPAGETVDPQVAERAARLAARAPRAADAQRDIYLCHNYCELGAVPFSSVLADFKTFLDTHPDDVVMTIIQDATTPADTAAAIEAAGLGDRVATLERGKPLPTLRQLIDERRTLLVFAEQGGPGAPAWYQRAYDWFQETPYDFQSTTQFNCKPFRGGTGKPLFLLNHWITNTTPDPSGASSVNSGATLTKRIETCIAQRGALPNVVAVNFSERGALVSTLRKINRATLTKVHEAKARGNGPGSTSPAPGTSNPVPPPEIAVGTVAPVPDATPIATLTGGDPQRFCATIEPAVRAVVAWAQTILGDSPASAGVTDLLYAPVLTRTLGPYVETGPVELARRATPILQRAQAAEDALRVLGVSDADMARLADQASAELGSSVTPDGIAVAAHLRTTLERTVPADRLEASAAVFEAGQPDPATQLDLGYVAPSVGQASGFACTAVTGSL